MIQSVSGPVGPGQVFPDCGGPFGASLILWAIAEGRSAAHAVDTYLMGESDLPAPVRPGALPLAVV